ncbi:MAG: hypothetical protein HGA85_04220 [Nanoarchaeota archaeon]|nr:hypothetical protein [Nanoarchaeota archaeon]
MISSTCSGLTRSILFTTNKVASRRTFEWSSFPSSISSSEGIWLASTGGDISVRLFDDVKANMLWLRQKVNDLGEGGITYPSIYLWKAVADKASQISPEQNMPKVQFDNANDIFLVRSGFSYSKDTVFQVDGGEERGSGHSQAQGYYLYALGEPFLDYEQVPLDDDVRAETFKNGVSLQPDTQPKEGSTGYYSAKCGFAPLNQYYGMSDCPVSGTYPDFRNLPLKYGGDVEDYMGTSDSNLAGAFVWRPYKNADPVREYFVKFGDLVAKRTVVTGVTQGQGIYHNFINLYNEFTEKVTGNNFTFSRNGNNMATQVVYSDIPLTFSEDSNLNSCFAKTDCSGSNRGTSKYRRAYYHADGTEADFIISHHWYTNNYKPVSKTGGNDKGLVQAGNTIIFDTDNDGTTINGGWSTDGWALAYNDFEVAAFNATSITQDGVTRFSSDSRVSVNIKTDLSGIIVTLNTMERAKNIDTSKKVKVTIDVGSAAVGGVMHDGAIVQSTISGSKVSFEASSSQNSDTYQIIADDDTPVQLLSVETTSIAADSITITSRVNKPSIITLSWGYSSALGTDITSNSQVNTISGLKPLTQVYYQVKVCDISNQCVTSGIYSALTLDASNVLPEIVSMEARDVFSTGFRVNLALTAEADATLIVAETEDMASPKEYISPTMMRNHYFLVSGLSNGTKYYWKLFGKDSQGNSYSSDTKVIMTSSAQSFVPQLTGFDGMTTDISSISDWSTIQHLILEDTRYGRIEFEDRVNGQGIDMASIVKLNFASISVNTKEAPGMDAPATLFFYRLPFKSPVILVDGDVCPEDICSFLSYSGNVLAVRVSHFSEYSVKEGAPREIKASSSGSSARPRPVIESEPEENVVITKENEFSAPSQNEVTALVIKESIAPEKKGPNLFFPIIILLGLVIVVPHLGKRRIDPEQAELIGKLLSAPDRSKRSMMTKSAETPIVLDDMKACNLLDLARVVYSLSDAQYKQYANDIQMWIACSLYLPDVANIMQYASGREDVYRILYNLHQKENNPGYIPITRVPENIVSCDMHSSSYMLRLRNGQTVQSLNHLMTLLPFMSGEVFEAHVNKGVNEIALWAREQNDSMGSMLSEMKSKEQMHSFLKSIKCDQEMHRLLSSI